MIRLAKFLMLLVPLSLIGCMQAPPMRDDPAYAPVLPRTPLPQELNNGAIYQPGFEMSLYNDRKAHRVGDKKKLPTRPCWAMRSVSKAWIWA